MSENVGFIGLGIMGKGMVLNLLKNDIDVCVWNRSAGKVEELVAAGATAASSPADIASKSDLIFICVSDTPDVEAVVLGSNGVIEGVKEGSLVIDHSTISPQATKEIATKLNEKGVHMLDAPISGGSEGAAKGTLSIMIGGEADQIERVRPHLEAMGKTITHVGGQGAGQSVKLVNQILVAGTMVSLGEAMLFAQASGLDLEKTLDAVSGGAAGSWTLSNRGPQVAKRDWRPGFSIDLQQKDLRLVLESADQVGVPALATALAFNYYRTLQTLGLGGEGNHAIVKAMENMTGIKVGE
ncbi:MAG: NAD(P)-dependent oxidoreductase [Anaerolineae bacterium]